MNLELDLDFSSVHDINVNWTFGPVLIGSGSNQSSELDLPITTNLDSDLEIIGPGKMGKATRDLSLAK